MNLEKDAVDAAKKLADETIATNKEHIYVAFEYASILADYYKANRDIIMISVYLMDYKLKEAHTIGNKKEHIKMAIEFANKFLNDYNLKEWKKQKIINAILSHHGTENITSLESEIVMNSDCYRFIHPKGVFAYFNYLSTNGISTREAIKKILSKMEEKYQLITLEKAKEDLAIYYMNFKNIFEKYLDE